jgi:hypothetical protein
VVVDYEAAWGELAELIADKTQHGREALLTAMAEIAARNRVPSGELSRLLRLYGVEVERARSISAGTGRDEPGALAAGFGSAGDIGSPDIMDRGGHDGSRNGSTAGNGRAR